MSTNSTMINDRYCWNCGLAEHECDSPKKEDFNGYCIGWEPTETDTDWDDINDFYLEENEKNKLLGLKWLKENTLIEGEELLAHTDELLGKLDSLGLRLPTREEWEVLCELPKIWDAKLKGYWFAETIKDLGFPTKSLFLPASGNRSNGDGQLYLQGAGGTYWSSTVTGSSAYYLYFSSDTVLPANSYYRAGGFAVRCIKK